MTNSNDGMVLRLAIGHATIESAIAETMLEGFLIGLLESRDEKILDKPNTMGSLITECKKRLKKREDLESKQEALDLLDELHDMKEKRNRLIHDVVAVDQSGGADGDALQYTLLGNLWRSPGPGEPIEISDIWQLASDFRRVSGLLILWATSNLPFLTKQWSSG